MKTKAVQALPEGYAEIYSVNLQKDKKPALIINALSLAVMLLMAVVMNFFVPFKSLFSMEKGLLNYALRFIVLLVSIAVYMVLHEAVHGITMKLMGTKKVKFGFTGMYAFAGSEDYYSKGAYITIALAPVVLFAVLLAVINCCVPAEWFWVVYSIQICNIAGAAGDMFVTVRFSRMPEDILVRDTGIAMTVYSHNHVIV